MKKEFSVELPWPPRGLSPNARLNRYAKATLFKNTKLCAKLHTKNAMRAIGMESVEPKGDGLVNVRLVSTPPILRYRDEDNLIANCKATLDGIAEAIKVNDHYFHFREQIWNKPSAPGKLTVVIDWEDGDA